MHQEFVAQVVFARDVVTDLEKDVQHFIDMTIKRDPADGSDHPTEPRLMK